MMMVMILLLTLLILLVNQNKKTPQVFFLFCIIIMNNGILYARKQYIIMKHTNIKKFIKEVAAAALLLAVLIMGQNVFAQGLGGPDDDPFIPASEFDFGNTNVLNNRFLGQSGNNNAFGLLDIVNLELAPNVELINSVNDIDDFLEDTNFLGLTQPVLLRQYGTAIFDTILATGDTSVKVLNIGFNSIQAESETPNAATLKVDGQIRIESFADTTLAAGTLRPLCTYDYGVLEVCGESATDINNGICTGTPVPQFGAKTWNNQPFDWNIQSIYIGDPTLQNDIRCDYDDPTILPNEQNCVGGVLPPVNPSTINLENPVLVGWAVLPETFSSEIPVWTRISAYYHVCSDPGQCGPMGGSPGETTISNFVYAGAIPAYSNVSIGACNGSDEMSCESVTGCNWVS